LQIIQERAAAKGLQFVLAGGHAVIAHGHQRATFDLDLIVRRDDRTQWLTLVEDLGSHSNAMLLNTATQDVLSKMRTM
jgi:hypothetical protein